MGKMNVSTRKIEVILTSGELETLDKWSYACRRMSNIAISRMFALEKVDEWQSLTDKGKKTVKKLSKEAGTMTSTRMNFMYRELSVEFSDIPSCIRAGLTRTLNQTYQQKKSEIHKGLSALPTFRNGMPIPFNISSKYKTSFFQKSENGYTFNPFGKKFGIEFETRFGKDRSNNRAIVQNIYEGKYELCDSSIQLSGKKVFLLLTFKSPKERFKPKKGVVVTMNLGMNVPAYMVSSTGDHMAIGNKNTLLKQRLAMQSARKRLQKELADTKGGRGRKKKLQALNRLRKSERNFVKTKNHQLSYKIIKFALENKAEKILIEDLQGIARDENEISKYVLRNWSYFELQQFITYKAAKFGIVVEVAETHYISQKCTNCGHTDKENLQDDQMQCVVCGHKLQKDHNAALNVLKEYQSSLKV